MLYSEIIAVCSQIHTKYINTLCGQNVDLLNVKAGGTYSDNWALEGLDSTGILHTSGMSRGVVWSMQIVLEELNMELARSQLITSTQNIAQVPEYNGATLCFIWSHLYSKALRVILK
jgi:hypothetical protein